MNSMPSRSIVATKWRSRARRSRRATTRVAPSSLQRARCSSELRALGVLAAFHLDESLDDGASIGARMCFHGRALRIQSEPALTLTSRGSLEVCNNAGHGITPSTLIDAVVLTFSGLSITSNRRSAT